MRAIVDRIEDDVAVLIFEDGGRAYLPAHHLPAGAGAGTVLCVDWRLDTDSSTPEVAALIERLRRGSEGHV